MARNITASKRGFGYDPVTRSLGVYVDGALVQSYPPTPGRTYFVNNITGSSANDGLSWANAMDEVSTAITASEVYRQLGGAAPDVTTNDYVRNTITVQATGTAYAAVSALPSYCDIVGLGADPRGNGAGIAQIDGAGAADAMAGSSRGLGLYNIQCDQSGAGAYIGLDCVVLFRSRIEDCAFTNQGTSGIRIVTGGGVTIRNVICSNDTVAQITGLTLGNGATNNSHKIVDCEFFGDTNGVSFSSVAGKQTVFKNCYAYGGTYGFLD
ncbi:hypothetical protein LCGC14_0961510, partial [marine sediment metagenome]